MLDAEDVMKLPKIRIQHLKIAQIECILCEQVLSIKISFYSWENVREILIMHAFGVDENI